MQAKPQDQNQAHESESQALSELSHMDLRTMATSHMHSNQDELQPTHDALDAVYNRNIR